jgi:hypothetical protein
MNENELGQTCLIFIERPMITIVSRKNHYSGGIFRFKTAQKQ